MSRVANQSFESPVQISGDFAMTGAGPDVSGVVASASRAPDCAGLLRSLFDGDDTYSARKLERLTRRFGLPLDEAGQPAVDAAACFARAAEFVEARKFVSAKKVLEIGLNGAVPKTAEELAHLTDLAKILDDFIDLNEEINGFGRDYHHLGAAAYGWSGYGGDVWSLGLNSSYEDDYRERELNAYFWEDRLSALRGRLAPFISGFARTPALDSASVLAKALDEALESKQASL